MDAATLSLAADTLRAWALDEDLKAKVMANPALATATGRIARRYMAGSTLSDALEAVKAGEARGHLGSIECMGESVRSADVANSETRVFEEVAQAAGPSTTVSLDLSHVGSVVSRELGLENGLSIAKAARSAGTYAVISAEGSSRTDLVLDLYEAIAKVYPETGITLQARLHRTPADLARLMKLPGPIRIAKGAFLESGELAHPRGSQALTDAYLDLAETLVKSGHRVNLATHDPAMVDSLKERLGDSLRGDHVEFEMLMGLGTQLLDSLHAEGYRTREYVVFGPEWWLYVLNRIAEHPAERVMAALADINPVVLAALPQL